MCQAARCGSGVAVMMPGLILVSQGGVTFTAMEQNKVNPWREQANCERQVHFLKETKKKKRKSLDLFEMWTN